jgi:hypothetical protein
MARQKKVTPVDPTEPTDEQKIAAWLEKNKVKKIAQNVSGGVEPKGFFGRRPKKKVAPTPVKQEEAKPAKTKTKTKTKVKAKKK